MVKCSNGQPFENCCCVMHSWVGHRTKRRSYTFSVVHERQLLYFDALKFILNNPVDNTCSINGLTLSWWQNITWPMQTDFWWRKSMVPYSISRSPWLNDTKRNNPCHISTPKWAIDTMSILLKYVLDISRLEMLLTCKNIEFWNGGEHISQMTCIKPWLVCTRTKMVWYGLITSVTNIIRLYSQHHHFAKTSECKYYDTHIFCN